MTEHVPLLERKTRLPGRRRSTVEQATTALFEGRERFAACVAHELRTPLATQRALLELALADPDADTASWREVGGEILAACMRQERLLEACLTLARSQDRPQRYQPVDLAAVMSEALAAHDLCGLERVGVLEPAWTVGDPDVLERLAANLVSNAIRHNVAGGWIEVGSRTESGRAALSVANSGSLVPAAELERLFQPFQRLGSSSRCSNDGVGLGLAIVRAIADAHGATVTVQAHPAGGLGIDVVFSALD